MRQGLGVTCPIGFVVRDYPAPNLSLRLELYLSANKISLALKLGRDFFFFFFEVSEYLALLC